MRKFFKDVQVIEHPLTSVLGQENFTDQEISLKNLSKAQTGKSFYGIQLDNRIIKTIYKDDLLIASKPLAESLAREWDSQNNEFNPQSLKLNTLISKSIRSEQDQHLKVYLQEEILSILDSDQISFIQPDSGVNENLLSQQS